MIEDKLATTIIVEGIRSPFEVNMFKENFDDFIILSILQILQYALKDCSKETEKMTLKITKTS